MTDRREALRQLLGESARVANPTGELLFAREQDGYRLETWSLTLNTIEAVPAYIAYPLGWAGKLPLVVFNHSHGGNFTRGKEEMVCSSEYLQPTPFVKAITSMGYACACIDMWSFGDRRGKKEEELVKEFLWRGKTVWGMRLFDNMAFVDFLCGLEQIDSGRIAAIGMSMGGLMSWWLAALDTRIKVAVDIAGQVNAETLIEQRGLDGHGFYYYLPGLLRQFATLEVQELIVPRARLSLSGRDDKQCPLAGVKILDAGLRVAYQKAGAPQHWESHSVTGGHQETAQMRYLWKKFLQQHL